MHHRLYVCSCDEEERQQFLGEELAGRAAVANPGSPFFTGLWTAIPDDCPLVSVDSPVVVQKWAAEAADWIDLDPSDPASFEFEGHLYSDGSAEPAQVRDLARAGSAVVLLNEEAVPLKRFITTVDPPFPRWLVELEGLELHVSRMVGWLVGWLAG